MLTGSWCLVDPEVKKRIDASIASNKQDITMCDNERKQLDEEMKKVLEDDSVFKKRHACLLCLLCIIC